MPIKEDSITVASTTDDIEEVKKAAGVEEGDEEKEEKEKQEEEGKEESKEGEKEEEKGEEESKSDEESEEEKGTAKKEESEEEEEDSGDWSKARKKMLRRINKLTARLKQIEGKEPEEEEEEEEPEEEPETVMAEDRPKKKDYKTQEEYEDAITDWRIDQREAKKALEAAQIERQREY